MRNYCYLYVTPVLSNLVTFIRVEAWKGRPTREPAIRCGAGALLNAIRPSPAQNFDKLLSAICLCLCRPPKITVD